jgi:hypothetical protein
VSAIKLSPWDRPDLKTWLTDQAGDWDALIFAKTDRVFRSAPLHLAGSADCRAGTPDRLPGGMTPPPAPFDRTP